MRRPETELLHGPWPDANPTTDEIALKGLAEEFASEWIIWRSVSPQRESGDWCARRARTHRAPAGLSASSPEELRRLLQEATR